MEHAILRLSTHDAASGELCLACTGWPQYRMEGLAPALVVDAKSRPLISFMCRRGTEGEVLEAEYEFAGKVRLSMEFSFACENILQVRPFLRNEGGNAVTLNHVTFFQAKSKDRALAYGARPEQIRVFEQGNYWGRVRIVGRSPVPSETAPAAEPNETADAVESGSDLVSVIYDPLGRMAFLAGFLTSDRWLGRITLREQSDGRIANWAIGFDGGDLQVGSGEQIGLETFMFSCGPEPWALLEQYAEAVAAPCPPMIPRQAPVSWCSWYPYRLGVSEARVLENARIAAERLKPLGLSVMEVDLGWETDNLPSTYEENERFPHGLRWLADELRGLGFDLGVWKAPFSISEYDPLVREHPDWLIQGEDGSPASYWTWFWEPHGNVFILDLTHPGAQAHLRRKVGSLASRGVRYLKADFIGCVSNPLAKRRHDRSVVMGGGTEAARQGAQIIKECFPPDALQLNCGGPEMPGRGHWPLLYICNDTGNTGFISHRFQATNYQAVACHLFKNRRWGIVQPSCLCVGLPGTLEDARIRATVAFLAGGHVDISDDLTTLAEDRWSVLTATLPPLGHTAKPIDLFDPLEEADPYDYEAVCRGGAQEQTTARAHPPGSVWATHVAAGWDEWELVGVFSFDRGSGAETGAPKISSFAIPFNRLGIHGNEERTAFEFWSGQFVGTVPHAGGAGKHYRHPGDFQQLSVGGRAGVLGIAFFGPGVKLLRLCRLRPHPWVVGTSFHQSCGAELQDVTWDQKTAMLCGVVCRPVGATGSITVSAGGMKPLSAEADGVPAAFRSGAHGSLVLLLTVTKPATAWAIRFCA